MFENFIQQKPPLFVMTCVYHHHPFKATFQGTIPKCTSLLLKTLVIIYCVYVIYIEIGMIISNIVQCLGLALLLIQQLCPTV